ncbi:SDR family oxidoreductase [Dokdonia sp. Hel_I_53]|uniref:SDR family oxidoreductase n=1 Tax=Dokdonia sp. Hel_I_53 TaxID=1566287 RepID=UPI00119A683B|nr:SDR family oxidoreductase [Dokdonia sp. Hel_I_53]TVZ51328.1 UDP-N-acetylglucosamine 4-epimerase [Dokdonia sp. Hel_I_53]
MQEILTQLDGKKVLITGGAGFIGSNLCEVLIENGAEVACLDNFATGHKYNLDAIISHPNFTLIEGDIRDITTCHQAVSNVDYVLHQAALGSVPRSIKDPATTNEVNVGGFLNMLIASKDKGIKRFVYAASSSTYGDSVGLPKQEDIIGKPLSPYAITKYVNELYADVFHKTYGIDCIGLRYFNVFGRKQDPNGAYAAVIPKFTKLLMNHESPVMNGDGTYSRDFTYIDNVIQMNIRAMLTQDKEAMNTVYNVAYGERTDLNELVAVLKTELGQFDEAITTVEVKYGSKRAGDVPHSLASIDKAKSRLGYDPQYSIKDGLKEAMSWYWKNLK